MELNGKLLDCPVCCDKVSSTNIINKYFSNISNEKVNYINSNNNDINEEFLF